MKIEEIQTTAPNPPTPAEQRVKNLQQQTRQAQQQAKRERANQQLKRAKQAVAAANTVTEAAAGLTNYTATVTINGLSCKFAITADGREQAVRIARHLFGSAVQVVV